MKIIAYSCLLYGACYLDSAMRSVIDRVDEYYVLYTPIGSHGHRTTVPSPDTREDLYVIAAQAAGHKLRWYDGEWAHEGLQRDYIQQIAPDADVIIPVDYDEVWQPRLFDAALQQVSERPDVRRWRVPFRHYYRSFYWCILRDPAYPHRVYNMRAATDSEATLDTPLAVNHFGYAIPPALMRYKWLVHGHKGELRRDCDYFTDVYEANRRTDCHPCGSEYWNAERVDPFAQRYLPDWMHSHAYAFKEVIE